jgi:hypothetical protein
MRDPQSIRMPYTCTTLYKNASKFDQRISALDQTDTPRYWR